MVLKRYFVPRMNESVAGLSPFSYYIQRDDNGTNVQKKAKYTDRLVVTYTDPKAWEVVSGATTDDIKYSEGFLRQGGYP